MIDTNAFYIIRMMIFLYLALKVKEWIMGRIPDKHVPPEFKNKQ